MYFSNRFAFLLLLGIIPISLSMFFDMGGIIFIVYNLVIVIFYIIDLFITPGKKYFEISRDGNSQLYLHAENSIKIRIYNKSRYVLDCKITDEVPMHIEQDQRIVKFRLYPRYTNEAEYIVVPKKRGEFEFGCIHLMYNGLLNLCCKKYIFEVSQKYKVYPNLRELRNYSFAQIKKMQVLSGLTKVKNIGIGTEFENLKEYSKGDDIRKINWMATARINKLIVNTYEPEQNQNIFILIDTSRVINSEIENIKKLDYAVNSAFVLMNFALKKNDNVGLMVFDSEVRKYVKAGKGSNQFNFIAENLYNVETNIVTADYFKALSYLNTYQKRRSLLCIFTELFDVDGVNELVKAVKTYAKNHLVLVVTIKDLRLHDLENMDLKYDNDLFKKAAAIKAIEERNLLRTILIKNGIICIDIPPDKLSLEVLNKYISLKQSIGL